MQYKIKKLYRNATNKEGKPYIARGQVYDRVTFYFEGQEGAWSINDFNHETSGWKEGDTVEGTLSEKNGFRNFELLGKKKAAQVQADPKIGKQLDIIQAMVEQILETLSEKQEVRLRDEPREPALF